MHRTRSARALVLRSLVVALSVGLATACSGSDSAQVPDTPVGRGQALVAARCTSCHGANGAGLVGPKLVGLAGSQVTLADGTTVTADDAYLRRALTDPNAQKPKGYASAMPKFELTAQELDDVIAYLHSLKS